jgi:uncharacterized protein YeaO (DUF488 family)
VFMSPRNLRAGQVIVVDRLWPRGVGEKALRLDSWYKGVAPSSEPRKWFHHDPARWDESRRRYFAESAKSATTRSPLAELVRSGNVTLLHGAENERHNNAEALRDHLESELQEWYQ